MWEFKGLYLLSDLIAFPVFWGFKSNCHPWEQVSSSEQDAFSWWPDIVGNYILSAPLQLMSKRNWRRLCLVWVDKGHLSIVITKLHKSRLWGKLYEERLLWLLGCESLWETLRNHQTQKTKSQRIVLGHTSVLYSCEDRGRRRLVTFLFSLLIYL